MIKDKNDPARLLKKILNMLESNEYVTQKLKESTDAYYYNITTPNNMNLRLSVYKKPIPDENELARWTARAQQQMRNAPLAEINIIEYTDEDELKPVAKILRSTGFNIHVWTPGPRDAKRIDIRINETINRHMIKEINSLELRKLLEGKFEDIKSLVFYYGRNR